MKLKTASSLIGLYAAGSVLFGIGVAGIIFYVAAHFISKWW